MSKSSINNCQLIEIPKISDSRGNLSYIEANRLFPFEIQRIYYLYDVPGGADRGGMPTKILISF